MLALEGEGKRLSEASQPVRAQCDWAPARCVEEMGREEGKERKRPGSGEMNFGATNQSS
jgi:hypothetical protein